MKQQHKPTINEQMDIYHRFLKDPQAPKGRAKAIISKFIKKYGEDASQMAVDRFAKQNNLKPEEKYILKYVTKNSIKISSQPGGPDFSAVTKAKATNPGEDPNMLGESSKGAMNYFSDLKYNYQKAFRYLDVEEREEYKRLVKDFFSKLQVDDKVRAVNEAKATCCHRCGRVHVKGTPCKKPYLKGKKSCAIKEVQSLKEFYSEPLDEVEEEDAIDTVTMDVPLFIRALEYAREDAQEDIELHDFAEKAIAATKEQGTLTMEDYDMLVGNQEQIEEITDEEEAKVAVIQRFKRGETDTLPEDPKAELIKQMMDLVKEAKPGLWANINAKRARGEKPSHGNSKAFKDAVKAGNKIKKNK
jgi:hypothetical protein